MKLQFLHESVRDHLAAEPLRPVWESRADCFSSLPTVWDGAVAFVCERSGSTRPLLFCWESQHTSDALKRRAIGLWGEFGTAADWEEVFAGTIGSGDTLLQDAAGHALRAVLQEASSIQVDAIYASLRHSCEFNSKAEQRGAAMRTLAFLIGGKEREAGNDLLRGLQSRYPDVRAATLQTATENRALDAPLLQVALRLCRDESAVVRDLAWCAIFSAWRRGASPEFEAQIQEVMRLYQHEFQQPCDVYVQVCWMGRSPAVAWVTQRLIQIACDVHTNEIVRWMALRHLMRYGHRRFIDAADWQNLEAVKWPEPAQKVWQELQKARDLFDRAKTLNDAGTHIAHNENVVPQLLYSPKARAFAKQRNDAETEVMNSYRQCSDNPWLMVESAYKFYALSPNYQKEYAEYIAWLLEQETSAEQRRAISFLGNVGMSDPWIQGLRLKSLQHSDAHIRHYTATSTLDFCDHCRSVPFLLHNLRKDENETARWDAGGSLIALVGPAAVPEILFAAQNDTSPQVRAFMLERLRLFEADERVHEAFLDAIVHDPSDAVRVRAIRSYERIGDERALPVLESLFDDTATTPAGNVGEVARQVHASIFARLQQV